MPSAPACWRRRAPLPTTPRSAPASISPPRELAKAPYFAERQTIDVSGDGTNNAGRDVGAGARRGGGARHHHQRSGDPDRARRCSGIREHTHPPGGLAHYYRTHVIGGPGSFVMVAKDFESFGEAIIKKMIAEVADAR